MNGINHGEFELRMNLLYLNFWQSRNFLLCSRAGFGLCSPNILC